MISPASSWWVTAELAFDTLSNVIKEFWPDIRRKMHPAKPSQAQATAQAAAQ